MWSHLAIVVSVPLLVLAGRADAQAKGSGTGHLSWTPPVTKDAGPPTEKSELRARDEPFRHERGLLGAPGAAPDEAGPTRLGPMGERAWSPSFGEAAQGQGGGEYETWRSGDRIRSWSSADVRATRAQQAPDLEWATPSGSSPEVPPAAAQPQEPHGKGLQKPRQRR